MGASLGDLVLTACALVGALGWFFRLEGEVRALKKIAEEAQENHKLLEEKHYSLDRELMNGLGEVRQSLARIEGALGVKN